MVEVLDINPIKHSLLAWSMLTQLEGITKPNLWDFILKHGKDYDPGPDTFKGPRMEQGMCYMNCMHRVLESDNLTYVEGYVTVYGIPIQHAWLVDTEGNLIDPTLANDAQSRVGEYFGVPFSQKYVLVSAKKNGYYGLLDPFYNRKTLYPLIEGKTKNWSPT